MTIKLSGAPGRYLAGSALGAFMAVAFVPTAMAQWMAPWGAPFPGEIERGLEAIAPDASLAGQTDSVPWLPLRQLFDAFAGIRGIGFAKMTKALHPKRPALIPLLDSAVRKYLEDDDPGDQAPFGERALQLVRGYKTDLDRNRQAVRAIRLELARLNSGLTEVRILDLLILSAADAA